MNRESNRDSLIPACLSIADYCSRIVKCGAIALLGIAGIGLAASAAADIEISRNRNKKK